MAAVGAPSARERAWTVAAVAAVHLAFLLILLSGPASPRRQRTDEALSTFEVTPPVLPAQPVLAIPPTRAPKRASRAAPPNLVAEPDPVVVPVPVVLPQVMPLVIAPLAADGMAANAGAAAVPGAGTGAGGAGKGLGSGDGGPGTDGGGSRARLIHGTIGERDYPKDARHDRLGGAVTVRFTVRTDGRATDCAVTRSSGVPSLDAVTCALIVKRFRYEPARDAAGSAVAEERGWRQSWWLEGAAATSPLPASGTGHQALASGSRQRSVSAPA